jgi:D-3-phosphoglycerate dehydrogenase
MRAAFIDCPPFLHALYQDDLHEVVPELEVNVGDPGADEIARLLDGCRFALVDHTTMDAGLLERCSDLRCIVFLGTGAASFIDVDAAERLGIRIRTYGGYGDQSVAEHALALMLAAGRRIAAMDRAVRSGRFQPLNGIEFAGKTLGVVGTGGIGRVMVRLGAGIGMNVIAWNRSGVPDDLPCEEVALGHLMRAADVVSLHLLLSDETRGLIGRDHIAHMKPGAILVNTARGALVDEAALIEALEGGRIGHAALDVFAAEPLPPDHPFTRLDNVTLSAHAAFATDAASSRLLETALRLLKEEMLAAAA